MQGQRTGQADLLNRRHRRLRRSRRAHPLGQPRRSDGRRDPAVGREGALGTGVDPVLQRGQVGWPSKYPRITTLRREGPCSNNPLGRAARACSAGGRVEFG